MGPLEGEVHGLIFNHSPVTLVHGPVSVPVIQQTSNFRDKRVLFVFGEKGDRTLNPHPDDHIALVRMTTPVWL